MANGNLFLITIILYINVVPWNSPVKPTIAAGVSMRSFSLQKKCMLLNSLGSACSYIIPISYKIYWNSDYFSYVAL